MEDSKVGKHRCESDWRSLYEEHKVSGKSMTGFCRSRGIAVSSYSKWKDKFEGRERKSKSFNKLAVVSSLNNPELELELPKGIRVKLKL